LKSTGTLTLSAPAPQGGVTVVVFSNKPAVSDLDLEVVIPAGQTTASFQIPTLKVRKNTLVTISAESGGVVRSARLTVRLR
jgi:hypothetical protein